MMACCGPMCKKRTQLTLRKALRHSRNIFDIGIFVPMPMHVYQVGRNETQDDGDYQNKWNKQPSKAAKCGKVGFRVHCKRLTKCKGNM